MFKIEALEDYESYDDKINYAKEFLIFLSESESRIVYALDDDRVIKFAKNEQGTIENNVEKYYSDKNWDMLTKVFDYEDDFMWVISEKAIPIDEKTFKEKTGISTEDLYTHLYFNSILDLDTLENNPPDDSDDVSKFMFEKLKESRITPFSIEILQKSKEFGFETSDIYRLQNLGLAKRDGQEKVVIVDYGNFESRFRKFPPRTSG